MNDGRTQKDQDQDQDQEQEQQKIQFEKQEVNEQAINEIGEYYAINMQQSTTKVQLQGDSNAIDEFMDQYQDEAVDQKGKEHDHEDVISINEQPESYQSFTFGEQNVVLEFNSDISDHQFENKEQPQNQQVEIVNNSQTILKYLSDTLKSQWKHLKKLPNSMKYLLRLFCTQCMQLIVILAALFITVKYQLDFDVDKKCKLEEIYGVDKDQIKECPISSYLMINTSNIIIDFGCYYLFFMFISNICQIKYRKLTQCVFLMVILGLVCYDCMQYNVNRSNYQPMFILLMMLLTLGLKFYSKHNSGVILYRLGLIAYYMITFRILNILIFEQKENHSMLLGMIIQYSLTINKRVTQIYMQYKLKSNLQYDDVTFVYIYTTIFEYCFFFDQLLIQDTAWYGQILATVNFIIVQVWNINNINLVYLSYQIFVKQIQRILGKMVYYNCLFAVLSAIVSLTKQYILSFHIFFVMNLLAKQVYRFMIKDNEQAQKKQLENIKLNGYQKQKINQLETVSFVNQQSIIGYFHFMVYQILLILTKLLFETDKSNSQQFQVIYKIEGQYDLKLNISCIIIFNLGVLLLLLLLISVKSPQKLRIMKQSTRQQMFLVQVFLSVRFICLADRKLFQRLHNTLIFNDL